MNTKDFIRKTMEGSPAVANFAKVTTMIALVAASVPTVMEAINSYRTGVSYGDSNKAFAQHRMWQKNFECTSKNKFKYIENPHGIQIGSIICMSGDILISGKKPGRKLPVLKWVGLNSVFEGDENLMEMISPISFAHGHKGVELEEDDGKDPVKGQLCPTQKLNETAIVVRVMRDNMTCEDLIYSTYTGELIKRNDAPCYC